MGERDNVWRASECSMFARGARPADWLLAGQVTPALARSSNKIRERKKKKRAPFTLSTGNKTVRQRTTRSTLYTTWFLASSFSCSRFSFAPMLVIVFFFARETFFRLYRLSRGILYRTLVTSYDKELLGNQNLEECRQNLYKVSFRILRIGDSRNGSSLRK